MKNLVQFFFIFGLVLGIFSVIGCSGTNLIWSTSNGIVSYNRHTGQFEMLWENTVKPSEIVHDTIYLCPEDSILWLRIR